MKGSWLGLWNMRTFWPDSSLASLGTPSALRCLLHPCRTGPLRGLVTCSSHQRAVFYRPVADAAHTNRWSFSDELANVVPASVCSCSNPGHRFDPDVNGCAFIGPVPDAGHTSGWPFRNEALRAGSNPGGLLGVSDVLSQGLLFIWTPVCLNTPLPQPHGVAKPSPWDEAHPPVAKLSILGQV